MSQALRVKELPNQRLNRHVRLTPAEQVTFDLVQMGIAPADVIKRLGISSSTFSTRMKIIRQKIESA